jgi:hypothetical protein
MKKLLIKNLTKKNEQQKKMRLKYDRKKSIEYEIWKKKVSQTKNKLQLKQLGPNLKD